MAMKKSTLLLLLFALLAGLPGRAQELRLRKGVVLDSLFLADSLPGHTGLYLPTNFDPGVSWPLLLVLGEEEDLMQMLRYYRNVAESNGYILAASRLGTDSATLTKQVVHMGKVLRQLAEVLPLDRKQISLSGFGIDGQLAALMPNLLRGVQGVLTLGAVPLEAAEATADPPADFVGIMGRADFGYPEMIRVEAQLDRRKTPHFVLYYEGGHQRPPEDILRLGLEALDLLGMKSGRKERDTGYIQARFEGYINYLNALRSRGQWLLAFDQAEEGIHLFEGLHPTESLSDIRKAIRKTSGYASQRREFNTFRLKEDVRRQYMTVALDEDLATFNLSNLGWWNYQMEELSNLEQSTHQEERLMGLRLKGFANALADDYIHLTELDKMPDYDALIFLYMLKTITDPQAPENYLQVISLTAKYDDFGTALYYLEELLKRGYQDQAALYQINHTALLRIGPEFNALIAKYLGGARYGLPEKADQMNR